MSLEIRLDILYYGVPADWALETALYQDYYNVRLLSQTMTEDAPTKEILQKLNRAVGRSETILILGGWHTKRYLPALVSKAVGLTCQKIGLETGGGVRTALLPTGATPFVVDDKIVGASISAGPQMIVFMDEDRACRQKLITNYIIPYMVQQHVPKQTPAETSPVPEQSVQPAKLSVAPEQSVPAEQLLSGKERLDAFLKTGSAGTDTAPTQLPPAPTPEVIPVASASDQKRSTSQAVPVFDKQPSPSRKVKPSASRAETALPDLSLARTPVSPVSVPMEHVVLRSEEKPTGRKGKGLPSLRLVAVEANTNYANGRDDKVKDLSTIAQLSNREQRMAAKAAERAENPLPATRLNRLNVGAGASFASEQQSTPFDRAVAPGKEQFAASVTTPADSPALPDHQLQGETDTNARSFSGLQAKVRGTAAPTTPDSAETPGPTVPTVPVPVELPTPEVPATPAPVELPTPTAPAQPAPVELPTPEVPAAPVPVELPTPTGPAAQPIHKFQEPKKGDTIRVQPIQEIPEEPLTFEEQPGSPRKVGLVVKILMAVITVILLAFLLFMGYHLFAKGSFQAQATMAALLSDLGASSLL